MVKNRKSKSIKGSAVNGLEGNSPEALDSLNTRMGKIEAFWMERGGPRDLLAYPIRNWNSVRKGEQYGLPLYYHLK